MEEFKAVLKKQEDLDSLYIEIPFDVKERYGASRAKVKVLFDDKVEYRGLALKMGMPCYIVGVNKEIRTKLGKNANDIVNVKIQRDIEERTVEIPKELQDLLNKNTEVKEYFDNLSYTHRKEYCTWITGAKKEETKIARLNKVIEMLKRRG